MDLDNSVEENNPKSYFPNLYWLTRLFPLVSIHFYPEKPNQYLLENQNWNLEILNYQRQLLLYPNFYMKELSRKQE